MHIRHNHETRRPRGAGAVEMGVVAPLIVALIMGQLETSRLGMVAQLLTTAAREGCRVAVVTGATQDSVQARVNTVLSGSGISVGTVTPTCTGGYAWNAAPLGTPITVSLGVPFSQVSWLANPFFFANSNVTAAATMGSEYVSP
jgi:Flp pilus assembly protein TadG